MTIHKVSNKQGKILRSGLNANKAIVATPTTQIIQTVQTSKIQKALGRNVQILTGAQELIPNAGAIKTSLRSKAWLYFHGNQQSSNIGSGATTGVVDDPGSGITGLVSLKYQNNNQAITPRINESLSGFNKFAIGCWVKFNSFNYAGPWSSWNSVSISQGQILLYNASGNNTTLPQVGVAYGSNFYTVTAQSESWKTGRWHYCLVELDKTNLTLKLWIDNTLQGTAILPVGFTLNTGSENFSLGGYNLTNNDITNMDGNIQDFAIFNDVLTQDERDWLWNKSYGNVLLIPEVVAPPSAQQDQLKSRIYLGFSGASLLSDIGVVKNVLTTATVQSSIVKLGASSLSFNGSQNSPLDLRINETLRALMQFSISCWVRFNSFSVGGPWASWDANTLASGQIALLNEVGSTPTTFKWYVSGSNFYSLNLGTGAIVANRWYWILCELDRVNLTAKVYLDNVLKDSVSLSPGFTLNTGGDTFGLGGYANNSGGVTNMNGYVDEFVILSGNTTQSERDWLWNSGNGNTLT